MSGDVHGKAGLVVVYHPFEEGASKAAAILEDASMMLASASIPFVLASEPVHDAPSARAAAVLFKRERVDVIVVRLATWADDTLVLAMVDIHDVVVISWAHRDVDAGSLCGAQQFNMVLRELGKSSRVVIGTGPNAAGKIKSVLASQSPRPLPAVPSLPCPVAPLVDGLKHLNVGILGARTQGMMEVAFDEFSIKEVLGPTIFSFPVHLIEERGALVDEGIVEKALDTFMQRYAGMVFDASREALDQAFRFHIALGDLARSRDLGALTIECYPRDMGKACISFALLADAGIPCACEGDVHAAILAWILQQLTGGPVNHVDLLDIDETANTVSGGHCGACSPSLAARHSAPRVVPARLAGTGACITFTGKAGPVTMVNLVGRKGTYRVLAVEGVAIDIPAIFPGATITTRLDIPVNSFLDAIERDGMGHHWIIAYGRCKNHVIALFSALGVRVVV